MIKIILFLLLSISTAANADFSLGYVVGRSSVYCSCTYEDRKIQELERENRKLKGELEKLQIKEEL